MKKQLYMYSCLFILLLALMPSKGFAEESTKYAMRNGQLFVPAIFLKNAGVFVDWNPEWRSVVFDAFQLKNPSR